MAQNYYYYSVTDKFYQFSCRYFHAGACVPVIKNLYVFGGLVESEGSNLQYEASKEMWKFAIDARKWTGPIVSIFSSDMSRDVRKPMVSDQV